MILLFAMCLALPVAAQQTSAMPHGMVYGTKPDTTQVIPASGVLAFMDKKVRVSVTMYGRITKITKQKGGWFKVDAGKGKIIAAHFKNFNINLPLALKGKIAFIEGVAAKQFVAADNQHFAGNTAKAPEGRAERADPKQVLMFEVTGLLVDK